MPDLRHPPLPFDAARAARTLEDLGALGFTPQGDAARALLEGAFGNSAYLALIWDTNSGPNGVTVDNVVMRATFVKV